MHQAGRGAFGLRFKKTARVSLGEAPHIREVGQGTILVLEPMEPGMKHDSFWRSLSTQDRRVARNWTWGVLIVYGAVALTVFGLASLAQHSADASKSPTATEMTAKADRDHVRR